MSIIVALVLAAFTALPALGQPARTSIVPGYAVGPITLGMPAGEARAAAAWFERETGCGIDLLVAGGTVIAAGTSWGGCLALEPPSAPPMLLASADPFFHSVIFGMSGSPAALTHVFGAPLVVRENADSVALIFANGLAAYIGVMHQGGVVTYLAVQNPTSKSAPAIGYFTSNTPDVRHQPTAMAGAAMVLTLRRHHCEAEVSARTNRSVHATTG